MVFTIGLISRIREKNVRTPALVNSVVMNPC